MSEKYQIIDYYFFSEVTSFGTVHVYRYRIVNRPLDYRYVTNNQQMYKNNIIDPVICYFNRGCDVTYRNRGKYCAETRDNYFTSKYLYAYALRYRDYGWRALRRRLDAQSLQQLGTYQHASLKMVI